MTASLYAWSAVVLLCGLPACGSSDVAGGDGGGDAAVPGADLAMPPDLRPAETRIKHLIVIVQENHTFDAYFGRYCTAPAGAAPTCGSGPACCERAPEQEPAGAAPVVLDDKLNGDHDPDHTQDCELAEMNGGRMDRYAKGSACSDPRNFAIADATLVKPYHDLARQYALADRYFQPVAGQSESNDMYLAVARFQFKDNDLTPAAVGHGCWLLFSTVTLSGRTVADLLLDAGRGFAFYAQGYRAMREAVLCPARPADCTFPVPLIDPNTCIYSPGDVPFEYYARFQDDQHYMKDYDDLAADIGRGALPEVAFVKGLAYKTEHPGFGTRISYGAAFVRGVLDLVLGSRYADDTLLLLTWDEGGGFFDHVPPPPPSAVDGQPYGTRVPLLAIGRFARKNWVSHVTMEHSSIVRFIEFNFLGQAGQLGARDAAVANIGSLLDPAETGIPIPED